MSAQGQVVRTGVNVFVFNNQGQFVMGLRKGSHGEGMLLQPPPPPAPTLMYPLRRSY